ncbi:hypothetical protein [Candidatus Moranella endobia]|uniref:hypothetical protein n=1 Tax=Candidatus Moranella endobia TaxID=1048758 RepID=UPI00039B94F1
MLYPFAELAPKLLFPDGIALAELLCHGHVTTLFIGMRSTVTAVFTTIKQAITRGSRALTYLTNQKIEY